MTDDLVTQLKELYRFAAKQKSRDWDERDEIRHLFQLVFNLGYDAADRIEKLEAELHSCFHRIEELQAALREITVSARLVGDYYHVKIARKALEGKDD